MERSGWICRTWIETVGNGWVSEFDRFDTEEEAREYGFAHIKRNRVDDVSREFEIYEDDQEWN